MCEPSKTTVYLDCPFGKNLVLEGIFWKLFTGKDVFWTGGGGLSVFPAHPGQALERVPRLDVGAGLLVFCEADRNEE